jgi:hypothetical protein
MRLTEAREKEIREYCTWMTNSPIMHELLDEIDALREEVDEWKLRADPEVTRFLGIEEERDTLKAALETAQINSNDWPKK